ncbi:MAG: SBBP repeat-containing protein [Saprospiraceae bacterium]|jgi:hypothetical protein
MTRFVFTIILSLFVTFINSQELKWIYKIGGTTAEYGNGIAIDADQNVYDITNFMGTVSVAPMVSYTSVGEEDVLIRKSTGLGILQWVKQLGGTKQDLAYDIAVDSEKNIYVTGTFLDTLKMDNEILLTGPLGIVQSFVLKLSNAGSKQWVKYLGSNLPIQARSLTANMAGEVLVSGNFEGTATFGVGYGAISRGANDVFILKLNSNTGESIFVRQLGGSNQDYVYQHCRDKLNNIILIGDFRDSLDLDPGSGSHVVISKGVTDIYLVKFNSEGVLIWGKSYGSVGADYGQSLTTDASNNVILTGRFSDNISFGNTAQALVSKGGSDIFLLKLDDAGKTLWVNGYGNSQNDMGNSVIVNKNGIIYLAGVFRDRVDFDPSTFFNGTTSSGGADVFIALYNQDGSYNDHFTLGGIANDQVADLGLKNNGDLISTGGFGAIADFDPTSSETNIFSNGGLDAFLWNTFVCVNPYIKSFHAEKTTLCPGDKVFIKVDEGYLNDATQWSWQRDSCSSITFASGDFLNIPIDRNTTFYLKGFGNCVVNDICKKIDIKLFKDSLIYQDINLCEGDTLKVGNNSYAKAGVYIDSLQSVSGCDSVVVTEINLLKSYFINQNKQVCNGDTIFIGGHGYYLPGNYVTKLTTVHGCDSTIVTNLTVLPSVIDHAEAIICKGDSILVGKAIYSKAGTYIQSSTASNGCEDLLVVNITVLETDFVNNVALCQGDSIKVGTHTYKSQGQYIDKLVSTYGCDSTITTHVTIKKPSSFNQTLSICEGDSVTVGNRKYFVSGSYNDILVNQVGCDSLVNTQLIVNKKSKTVEQDISLCEGESVIVGGHEYSQTGVYIDTLTNAKGCDSIVHTTLLVFKAHYIQNESICTGEIFNVGNQTFTKSGTYLVPLTNHFGCDSIITLVLQVNDVKKHAVSYKICPGDTIYVGQHHHTLPGIYIDTLVSRMGCDSIVTTTLSYNTISTNLKFDICQGEFVTVNNVKYGNTGIFRDTLVKADKCDSILIITVHAHPKYNVDTLYNLCKGSSINVGNGTYFNAGKYTEYLQTTYGCDSIIKFEIKVISFVPTFSIAKDTLKSVKIQGAEYQWYECRANEQIPFFGATDHQFVVLKSGKYALGITYLGCTFISDCIDVIISSTNDVQNGQFEYFPNPVDDNLSVKCNENGLLKLMTLRGEVLREYILQSGNHQLYLGNLRSGSYLLYWKSGTKSKYYKLLKI